MDANGWIALCALGLTIVGALGHVVWMLATIAATLKRIDRTLQHTSDRVDRHAEECDPDRQRLGWQLAAMELKLKELLN